MKVIPLETQIPFSQKRFNVELTGIELAFIEFMVANCSSGSSQDLGAIVGDMYEILHPLTNVDHDSFTTIMPAMPVNKISLKEFIQKIDDLNK